MLYIFVCDSACNVSYLSLVQRGMCEDPVRVSEVTILVSLVRKSVGAHSSEIGPVLWQVKLLMQFLHKQMSRCWFLNEHAVSKCHVLNHAGIQVISDEYSLLTFRSVSIWLSATPDGKTAVTNPLGSGRRKWIGSGTSTVVPFMCWSITFSMSCSWWIRPSNRAPKALQ